MVFDTFWAFEKFLHGASMALTGKPQSTNKSPKMSLNIKAREISFWIHTGREDGKSDTSLNRNIAYLLAYVEACGGRFPAQGIAFPDGNYVWLDRSVIERSLRDGHLQFDEEDRNFVLTPEGQRFLTSRLT